VDLYRFETKYLKVLLKPETFHHYIKLYHLRNIKKAHGTKN